MAFAFLNNITSAVDKIAPVIGAGTDLLSLIKGQRGVDVPQPQMGESQRYALSILKALANPNSSLVKEQTDIQAQQGMADLLRAIRSQALSDRRGMSLGRRPTYFDPERMDDAIQYQLSRAAPDIRRSARNDVIARLSDIAGGAGRYSQLDELRNMNYYKALGEAELAKGELRNAFPQDLTKGIQNLTGSIQGLQGLFKGQGGKIANPNLSGTYYIY